MKRRVPTACNQGVVITGTDSEKVSYVEMAKKLRDGIDLDTLGVKVTGMRKTKSGAMAFTVGIGEDGALAVDKLRVTV